MTGTIALSAGGRSFATWMAVNPPYEMPHIPTRPAAPRLVGQPPDRVDPVAGLLGGVLVEGDPERRARCRARRAGTARSPAPRTTRRASRPRRGASCPCRTGSSRGWPAPARPSSGRHRLADSSTPSRAAMRTSRSTATSKRARSRSGRSVRHAASIGAGAGDPATPPMACDDARRWKVASSAARGGSPTRTRGSPSGTTRSTDRTAAPASTASSTSPIWPPASSPSTTTTGSSSSASTATPSTSTPGRSPRAACRRARTPLVGAQRELREETGLTAGDLARAGPDGPVQLGHRRARGAVPGHRPDPRRGRARPDRGARGPLGAVRRRPWR